MAEELKALDEDWSTALCIAAHPDDLEYGTAAAVHRWVKQGKTVTYLLATRGEAGIDGMRPDEAANVREAEEVDGAREVGVEVVDFLEGHRDGVIEYGLALRRDLAREIRRRRADVVITGTHRERFAGGGTNQADHRAVGLAVLDACADAGNRWIFPELLDEGFEPWGGVRKVGLAGSPTSTHFVDVTGHFEPAVRSLEAHGEYLAALGDRFPAPRELLTMILGGGAGMAAAPGVQHAVLLEVFDR
jgi:LmbE family N-acetylglucosaminyl deacetylase